MNNYSTSVGLATIDTNAYRQKYGPWAVISGASDGTGAAYAQQLAAMGLNLVLIARRPGPLAELAEKLEKEHGIETRTASIDLFANGAGQRLLDAAAGLEVGLYISNDEDLETRAALARVIAGTVGARQNAYVTLSNKAEGCAPLSVLALAQAIRALQR